MDPHLAKARGRRRVFGLAGRGLSYGRASQALLAQCIVRPSFLLTAAGQSRVLTAFPVAPSRATDRRRPHDATAAADPIGPGLTALKKNFILTAGRTGGRPHPAQSRRLTTSRAA